MERSKALKILAVLTLAVFIFKAFPVASASTVPPGWVDTSYHTSTALDVSRGDYDSLIHPWWHIQGNSETVDGLSIIDRNSKTFFYPPFLHLFTAAFMIILPAGLATITSISLIYSLSAPATYLLSRSYNIDRKSSLLGAGLASASIPLIHSQVMGFWSFAAAFILGIISFSYYRMHREKSEKKYLAGYMIAGLASILTHWVFGAFIIGMTILDTLVEEKILVWRIPGLALASSLPFYTVFFATSSISSYITTSFNKFYPAISPAIILGGIVISRGRYRTIDIFSASSITGMILYYLGLEIPFGGMIQFALPILAGFYAATLHTEISKKEMRKAFAAIVAIFIAASLLSQAAIGHNSSRALTESEFNRLIDARDEIPEEKIVAGPEVGTWVTLASGDRRIVNPYADYNASELDQSKFYVLFSGDGGRP